MDFQHRMKRTALGTIVQRSIDDLRSDPQRALRRLADLGQSLFQGESQQRFVADVQRAIEQPDSPCYTLLMRVAESANPETLRMLSMNLGYTSFTYGVRLLRAQQEVLRRNIPSMLFFALQGAGQNGILPRADALMAEARELGIFSFIFQLNADFAELEAVMRLAKKEAESTFLLALPPELITPGVANALGNLRNVIVAIEATNRPTEQAWKLLRSNRCVYGAFARVDAANRSDLLTAERMRQLLDAGCMFSIFDAAQPEDGSSDAVATFVAACRSDAALSLFAVDWHRDTTYLSEAFSKGDDYLILHRDGSVSTGRGDGIKATVASLRQAILAVMPPI